MKNILLTTTALVAFAGAAAAEVSFSGDATLGYNDTVNAFDDNNEGFYWDANVAVTLSQELDNGVTASATFDFDVADDTTGEDLISGGYLLSVTTETAGLYYGDTSFAAETYWSAVGDMEADNFSEADGEVVLRGEGNIAGFTAGMSYAIADADGNLVGDISADDVAQLSVGAAGSFGNFSVSMAYQEELAAGIVMSGNGDFNASEVFAISGSTTFSGATVSVGYANNMTADTTSTGIKVAYPFGPVTATAYYVMEEGGADEDDNYGINVAYAAGAAAVALDFQDDQGTTKVALDGSYDLGNGLTIYAGYYTQDNESGVAYEDELYVAGSYDLGGGASVLVSYAEGADNADDEIGANDYQEGTTVEVAFTF